MESTVPVVHLNSADVLLAAGQAGPGNTLRIVLAASLVGAVLVAWFLLRGYGRGDDGPDDRESDG